MLQSIYMPKRIYHYIRAHKAQITKFALVGIGSFIIDMSLLIFFKQSIGMSPVAAVAVSQIIVISINFLLNKYWSFESRQVPLKQLNRYLILVLANYSLSLLFMYVFHDLLAYDYRAVRFGTILLFVTSNFLLYKYWVYKE